MIGDSMFGKESSSRSQMACCKLVKIEGSNCRPLIVWVDWQLS